MSGKPHVLLIGAGRMGGALLAGWLGVDSVDHVTIIDPVAEPPEDPRITHRSAITAADNLPAADIALIAVKPQGLGPVLDALATRLAGGCAVLSVVAGASIRRFQRVLGPAQPIIRAMPNTPAAIGAGSLVCCAGVTVTAAQRAQAEALLHAGGAVHWIEDEALMDAVTALSGSGPAYVFHMIEALAAAGAEQGLPPELADQLARETVIGAARLADASGTDARLLREQVTSPGGTTEAALKVLMREPRGLGALLGETLAAAAERSRILGAED